MIKVCFRVDGGNNVGLGHVSRCLSLAQAFRRNGHEVFFISKLDEGITRIKNENFDVFPIRQDCSGSNSTNIAEEINKINHILRKAQLDVLIVDSYNVSHEYFLALRIFARRLVYIDDINLFPYPVDIVINGNITGKFLGYQKYNQGQRFLVGPEFNLIRTEFCNLLPRKVNVRVNEIMITTGGADTYNLTTKLLNILLQKQEYRNIRINILVGSGFTNCNDLERLRRSNSNIFLYANSVLPNPPKNIIYSNVSSIMLRSDLAISAGGSTLYEFAACGTPVLAIIIADNQERIVQKMDELGYLINLGWYDQLNDDNFLNTFKEAIDNYKKREEISHKGQKLVDGKGTERIVQFIMKNLDYN